MVVRRGLSDDGAETAGWWAAGTPLAEVVAAAPLPTVAVLGMVEPLARVAARAHRAGRVLGLGDPGRVRLTPDGLAVPDDLDPGTGPDATPDASRDVRPGATPGARTRPGDADVRGLGAVLYALLVGDWPLPDTGAGLAGLDAAATDARGEPPAPATVRAEVSTEVSALAMAALGAGETSVGVRTAAAVHRLVVQLLASAQEVALLPPLEESGRSDAMWHTSTFAAVAPAARGRRKFTLGMGALSLGALALLGYTGMQVAILLGLTPPSPPRYVLTHAPVERPAAVERPAMAAHPMTPRAHGAHDPRAVPHDPRAVPRGPGAVPRDRAAVPRDPGTVLRDRHLWASLARSNAAPHQLGAPGR
ncbi:MAG TPA: hypothetical protein VGH99_17545 [Pseudonocardia sp.]